MINIEKHNLDNIKAMSKNTLVEALGIEITDIGKDFISGKMPVDERTVQPAGILHGGASVALAETLGSIAGNCCIDNDKQYCVGLEINANHIRPVFKGEWVYATSRAIHIGKKTQIWETKIYNESKKIVCISRLTLSINDKK